MFGTSLRHRRSGSGVSSERVIFRPDSDSLALIQKWKVSSAGQVGRRVIGQPQRAGQSCVM